MYDLYKKIIMRRGWHKWRFQNFHILRHMLFYDIKIDSKMLVQMCDV